MDASMRGNSIDCAVDDNTPQICPSLTVSNPPQGNGGPSPLKNMTKRWSSKNKNSFTNDSSSKGGRTPKIVSSAANGENDSRMAKTKNRKNQKSILSGSEKQQIDTRAQTKVQSISRDTDASSKKSESGSRNMRQKQRGQNDNESGQQQKARMSSRSNKLSMCFAVHCITATTESPNSTIQSIKGGSDAQDSTLGGDHDSSSTHPSSRSSPGQSRSGAGVGSSRSPYECPICFEQYQFEFEIAPVAPPQATQTEIQHNRTALMEDADTGSPSEAPCPEGGIAESELTHQRESELSSPSPSFKDHLPRLMQCGHTLCSKCLAKLSEDLSAQILGFVKCPICREMHYTEPVTDQEDYCYGGASITGGGDNTVSSRQERDSMPPSDERAGEGGGERQEEHHHFVFRVNYALLSAIEHNLMHISAEDLTLNSAANAEYSDGMEGTAGGYNTKSMERNARHRKTCSMYETISNRVCNSSTGGAANYRGGGAGVSAKRSEATHMTFEDIQKMLRPERIISQQHLNAVNFTTSMGSRAESQRSIAATSQG